MDAELLNNKFQVSENPGLDTRDPRFADIAGMVQQGNFFEAAALAKEIIEENIYDIRIICYFLYGLFDRSGPASFRNIFNSLKMVFSENWEAIGPLKNRLKHAKKSLVWLFKQSNKVLENEKKKEGEKWQGWLLNISADEIWDTMEVAGELQKEIVSVFEDESSAVLDGLSKITAWLDSFYKLIYKEPEPEPEEAYDSDETTDSESDPCDDISNKTGPDAPCVNLSKSEVEFMQPAMYGSVKSSGSYLLQMLLKKMDVFSRLLNENKTAGAALVADDINGIIANFDPQLYFPDLFSEFTRQYALNVDKLLAFKKCSETALWKSMDKLYKVDMETFVSMDADFHFSDPDSFNVVGHDEERSAGRSEAADNDEDAYYDDGLDDDDDNF